MQDSVLTWYAERGRNLAFRRTTDPYAILVSELMAQQTQASRAAEAWQRFLDAFPTFGALAAASPASVLRAWRGLGYNRRALALRRTAIVVVAEHGGRLPEQVEVLERLPGIGPYTARAVAALAFGLDVGPVDTNVRRVLTRAVLGLDAVSPGQASTSRAALQPLADAVVPPGQAGTWTHALMDIGSMICRPRAPRCDECPLWRWCRVRPALHSVPGRGTRSVARPTLAGVPAGGGRRIRRSSPATSGAHGTAESHASYVSTTRWLRGRIVDQLRDATDGEWVRLVGPIGNHGPEAVVVALESLRRDGLAELHPALAGHARLPLT